MKIYIVLVTIISIFLSCNSGQSGKESNSGADTNKIKQDSSSQINPSDFDKLKATDLNVIGDLSLGMKAAIVIEKLGQPVSKSKAEVWDADGWIHQDWEFPSKGISLNMSSEKNPSFMELFSINITSPCTFKTNKNIGIGNTFDEVKATYEKEIDYSSSDENIITVGSLYGGIIFEFNNKKVTKVFVGAAAE